MELKHLPSINAVATGKNIEQLRKDRGLSVRDLQTIFNFDAPQAIYKWQKGTSLPSLDNLLALSKIFGVSMDSILIEVQFNADEPSGSVFLPFLMLAAKNRIQPTVHCRKSPSWIYCIQLTNRN